MPCAAAAAATSTSYKQPSIPPADPAGDPVTLTQSTQFRLQNHALNVHFSIPELGTMHYRTIHSTSTVKIHAFSCSQKNATSATAAMRCAGRPVHARWWRATDRRRTIAMAERLERGSDLWSGLPPSRNASRSTSTTSSVASGCTEKQQQSRAMFVQGDHRRDDQLVNQVAADAATPPELQGLRPNMTAGVPTPSNGFLEHSGLVGSYFP
eukprot:COSAG02_NODE_2926_length_7728_cov_3.194521_2_plen_210_part_00